MNRRHGTISRAPGKATMSNNAKWAAISLAAVLGGSEARAQTPIPPSPKDFVMAASQSDRYEMLAAKVAAVQSQDPRVTKFADEMVRDHKQLSEDLRQAAAASGLPQPEPSLSSDEASLLGGLQSVRGRDFDQAYARQQVLAHAQAVAVEESFAEGGSDANLKKAARSALPTIRHHLDMAHQLRTDLGAMD